MKKKVLFALYNLDIGGIEKAMANLLKNFDYDKYDVTILLQEKKGIFLNQLPDEVHVKEYTISNIGFKPLRKIINRLKIIMYCLLNYHKYDYSFCYATYDIPSSIITRYVGKTKAMWVHSDYSYIYNRKDMCQFFDIRKINMFDDIIFVANEARDNFLKVYKNLTDKCHVINNQIDVKEIEDKAKEKIVINKKGYTFVFIGRLVEKSKCLTRLIKAFAKLNNNDLYLNIVGSGPDDRDYKALVEKLNLINNIKFMGNQSNPYPYLNDADCLVLSSNFEGFPVVYLEALVLKKQIVTTIDVSSNDFKISDYAYIANKTIDNLAECMKKVIDKPKEINVDINKLNKDNMSLLYQLMEDKYEV